MGARIRWPSGTGLGRRQNPAGGEGGGASGGRGDELAVDGDERRFGGGARSAKGGAGGYRPVESDGDSIGGWQRRGAEPGDIATELDPGEPADRRSGAHVDVSRRAWSMGNDECGLLAAVGGEDVGVELR
jgi:hypothetical protein